MYSQIKMRSPWVWIDTTWATNWLDPQKLPVRLLLLALMLAGLLLSASIPQAFESRGLAFAAAYMVMRVGRTAFVLWAFKDNLVQRRNFQRLLSWRGLSSAFWIAGGLAHDTTRIALWGVALFVEGVCGGICRLLGAWPGPIDNARLDRRRWALCRALRAVHHHCGWHFGNMLFKWTIARKLRISHLIGMVVLVLLIPAAGVLSPLALLTAATLVLVGIAVWEARYSHRHPVPHLVRTGMRQG